MAGRKPKSEIECLKPQFWYWHIKSRTDLNDCELDILFAEDENGTNYATADRPRIFESIRKNGTMPSDGSHRLRKFNLIDKVESHSNFIGSKNIITSPFWNLLQTNPIDLDKNTEILDEAFNRLNLKRIACDNEFFWEFMDVPFDPNDRKGISPHDISDFEHIFNQAISHIPDNLDLLALIGALYRESCLTFQLKNANILSKYFEIVSDGCLNTKWENPAGASVWDIAQERVIYGNFKYETSMRDKSNIYKNISKSYGVIVNKLDQRYIDRFESNKA